MNFKLNQNEQAVFNKMMADLPQVLQEGLFYETRDLFDCLISLASLSSIVDASLISKI